MTNPTTENARPLILRGVRQNNLKNLSLEIPHDQFVVITGVSGSGKSSLAFETIYAEGQRRFVESLSTYTRQFLEKLPRPDVDHFENVRPSIALEQRNSVTNSRSTVGTVTELADYGRLLFAKAGSFVCPHCGQPIKPRTSMDWAEELVKLPKAKMLLLSQPINALNPEGLRALISKGYRRFYHVETKEIIDFDELGDSADVEKLLTPHLHVLIDRLVTGSSERSRILEALEKATQLGKVKAEINGKLQTLELGLYCDKCQQSFSGHDPQLFSYNSPLGACPTCQGFGHLLSISEDLVVPDKSRSLRGGAIEPLSKPGYSDLQQDMFIFCRKHKIELDKKYGELTKEQKQLLWNGDGGKDFAGIYGIFKQLSEQKYKVHIRVFVRRFQEQTLCVDCQGTRLKKQVLEVKIAQKNLAEFESMTVDEAFQFLETVPWTNFQQIVAKEILKQIQARLEFLREVGLGYLALNRLAKTLSGGEYQRICLAAQLGSGLSGTLYVLDEPSIGLHPRDTDRLITILKRLRDIGNTVVVVEHDSEVIHAADYVYVLGPRAGRHGGELILSETQNNYRRFSQRVKNGGELGTSERPTFKDLSAVNINYHNLKNVTVDIPLRKLVCITGVSGSGKSSLVHGVLYNGLRRYLHRENIVVGQVEKFKGLEYVRDAILLDQKPIGKSSRSNPATYMKAWDEIRVLLASTPKAIKKGLGPSHFSFNVDGGRCPVCKGEGEIEVEMHFMADVTVPCEECDQKRFKPDILECDYRGKNVFELLHTTIDEASEIFTDHPRLFNKLKILKEVGLGYLELGQAGKTLSGGESQRLKIAATLEDNIIPKKDVVFFLDEPTTGLFQTDIQVLTKVLNRIVDGNNTVICIEHNLDVIAHADWVIDLGPEAGAFGGEVVFQGTPQDLVKADTLTGRALKRWTLGK